MVGRFSQIESFSKTENYNGKSYVVKLQAFEGPFDLLFHLIEKNNMKVYDISISEITDQYMDYLFSMQEMNLEIASEFIVMAATLLHIKSRLLLPENNKPEENTDDPREELIQKLIEYKKYKEFASVLRNREQEWSKVYYKLPEIMEREDFEQELDLCSYNLKMIYENLIKRKKERTNQRAGELTEIVKREKFSIKSKIKEILRYLKTKSSIKFSQIFNIKRNSKSEIILGFLAILELAKIRKVTLKQKTHFSDITIQKVKDPLPAVDKVYTYSSVEEL